MNRCIIIISALFFLSNCTRTIKYPLVLDQVGEEQAYPGANAVIVFDSTNVQVFRDGTTNTTTHKLIKVLNAQGRKEYGEATFSYITLYDTVIVQSAVVIRPDKKVIKVPKSVITDMPMPAWEGSKFYIPNLRFVKIVFPELEDGGAIEYRIKTITHNAPFDSTFDYWELFESTEPIKEKVFQISLPREMNLKWVTENGSVEHRDTIIGNQVLHTWQKMNVPMIVPEPSIPPLENIVTKLLITCTDTWEDYSRWYYKISEPKLVPDSAIISKVSELTKEAQTRDDTIRALYESVCKEIRYVETELIGKKGGYEPAPAPFTYKNRYGVCRDKAGLLVCFLRTAGIKESYMVLTNPMILDMKPEMPNSSQFNHAIVAIKTDTGFIYLDPTAENSREYLVPYEDNKPVLVCTEKGEGIQKTPQRQPETNLSDVTSEGLLNEDGTLYLTVTIKTSGMIDNQFRYICQMFAKEKLEQIFLSSFKSAHPGAVLDSLNFTDPQDFSKPMELNLYLVIPDYALKIGKEWHLSAGGSISSGAQSGVWNLSERKYPLYLWVRTASKSISNIKFPAKLSIKSMPSEFSENNEVIYSQTRFLGNEKKNFITIQSDFLFKTSLISPEQYKIAKSTMKKIEEYQHQEIILEEK